MHKELINHLYKLPNIGYKSAQKITSFLLDKRHKNFTFNLIAILKKIENCQICSLCNNLCIQNPCVICCDKKRENYVCVVENLVDVWTIEKSNVYRGRYYIISDKIESAECEKCISQLIESSVKNKCEIILALSQDLEGDAISSYIMQCAEKKCKVSKLAQGIPFGGKLDYCDENTLYSAIKNRKELNTDDGT